MTRTSCLSDATVAGLVERSLSSQQRSEIDIHVDGCASCRRILVELISQLAPSSAAEVHATCPARRGADGGALAKGTAVGRFIVLDVLGAGGMGVVYTAYDPELDRKVALKLLRPGARTGGGARAHLLTEAQITARVSHDNVIAIYDVGTYREQVFAAMELVEGTTLRRWMAERPRSWREVVEVFLLAGEGLAAAHAARVVHRDFKPENVLLGHDGRVKVSDFGLATLPAEAEAHVAGTPGYLAVEGYQPGGVDERGDQFSFCVALHEALHGSRPFSARALDELAAQVRRGPVLDGASRGVPARLNHVVRRGLALAPADRYPSMRDLLADIRRAVAARRRRRLIAAMSGALALAIAVTAFVVDPRTAELDARAASQAPCAGAADHLAGIWDPARRDAVRSAFARTTAPSASALFERTAARIDRYANDWAATWSDACEATKVRHEQPAVLFDLRMVCLDRARIQLRQLSDQLAAADAGAVGIAVTAAAALPPLDACSDVDALRANVSPLTAAARTEIHAAGAGDEAGIAVAEAAIADEAALADGLRSRPDFRLPFGCGEVWQLARSRRRPGPHVDFSLPGGDSAAGFAVFASAPGWVSRVVPHSGEVEINHGRGWFTTYKHMVDVAVSLHQYVGRGLVIGKVGNVGVTSPLGGPGPARLHYEQAYQPGGDTVERRRPARVVPYLEREAFELGATGAQVRTSTNNCFAGGVPGGATQYDVPAATSVFSPTRATIEIATRRSYDHALFESWYRDGWNGGPMPHTITGQPAVAVFNGELHVIARKSDGSIFDLQYSPFTGWKTSYLEGRVAGDPDIAVYGWSKNLHVVARGRDGFLYQWWTGANGAWARPMRMEHIRVVGTPALFSRYDTIYVVARAEDGALWSWRGDRRGLWTEHRLPGTANDDPDIAVDPQSGLVNVVARGADNRLYRWQSKDLDRVEGRGEAGWSAPELIDPDRVVTGAPAAAIYHGALHIVARGPDSAVHHWWKDATWHSETTPGAYSSNPVMFQFDDQLQTAARGPSGHLYTLWFDPVTGIWNVENRYAPSID